MQTKMNLISKLIKDFKHYNLIEETHKLKQKIINEIENIIKLYQYQKGFLLSEEQKIEARILLAKAMLCKAKNLFNPLLSSVIIEIINEANQNDE